MTDRLEILVKMGEAAKVLQPLSSDRERLRVLVDVAIEFELYEVAIVGLQGGRDTQNGGAT
jgi:hypothetical protein